MKNYLDNLTYQSGVFCPHCSEYQWKCYYYEPYDSESDYEINEHTCEKCNKKMYYHILVDVQYITCKTKEDLEEVSE